MTTPVPILADGFKMSTEGDKVVIEFGVGDGVDAAGRPIVRVSDRMVIPQAIAQRLAIQLDDALKPHAAALRAAEAKMLPPGRAAEAVRSGAPPSRPAADEAGTRAAQLIRLVADLDVPHQYERSFRIGANGIQANRFLLTFNARDVTGDVAGRVLGICDTMAIPPQARRAAQDAFEMANCIHMGFEGDASGLVCKLYLERAVTPEESRTARAAGVSTLLHLAFKWNMRTSDWVTSRYRWFPGLDAAAIRDRLAAIYDNATESCALATEVLATAAARVAAERMQYLEVDEDGTARRSYDLNLYNAKMQVRDIQSTLFRMRDRYGIRPSQFQALYDQVQAQALGHLAGGLHRQGEEFFNVYYGVVSLPHFSNTFTPAAAG